MQELGLTPEEMSLFFEEAQEQLDTMEHTLLALEEQPDNIELVDELFRAAHTLKGGSATVGLNEVAQLTHAIESLLAEVRAGERRVSTELADQLLPAVDLLRSGLLAALENREPPSEQFNHLIAVLETLQEAPADGGASVPSGQAAGSKSAELPSNTFSQGNVYRWQVAVEPDTPLASVRIYQALLIFEGLGEVLETDPPVAVLEDDEADVSEVTVYHAAAGKAAEIEQALADIPDIQTIKFHRWVEDGAEADEGPQSEPQAEPPTAPPVPAGGGDLTGGPERSVRVGVQVLDRLMTLVGELVVDRTRLANLGRNGLTQQQLHEELVQLSSHIGRITTDLQDTIMQARMIPVKTLFRKFPRLVRDLSRQLDKEVNFELVGEDTELDRSVIELLSDPLIHLLRNAVDHGLESAAERRAAGKPPAGNIRLSAFHQESHIYVEISDDGRGLDPDRLRRTVRERGLMTPEQLDRLSYQQLTDLIFSPGFSTASQVSTVSGRGVGMDVVRKNLEQVSGSITVRSEPGVGTTFTIQLPLTLAIIQALLVEIAGVTFAIPLAHVVEAVLITDEDVYPAHGWRMMRVRNKTAPLLDPGEVWGSQNSVAWSHGEENPVVIVQSDFEQLGILVDGLIGEEEVVIKNLGPLIGSVSGVSGASILGDGQVALIADIPSLAREVRQSVHR